MALRRVFTNLPISIYVHSSLFWLILSIVSPGTASSEPNECLLSSHCYDLSRENVRVIQPKRPTATLCFQGVERSYLYILANPVLHISRSPGEINESSYFHVVYGTSPDDADKRSHKTGINMLTSMLSSLRSIQQAEDLAFLPFNTSCYKIDTNVEYTARLNFKVIEIVYIAYMVAGVFIFLWAKTWSHNTTMHYGTGVLVGVLASVLILMLVLAKFVPSRLKSLIYIFLFLGTSASLFVLQSFKKLVTESSTDYFLEYWQYFLGYIVISGLVSFAIVYRYGPVEDKRSLSLIQWLLQGVGLGLVFYSTQVTEVSVALVLLLLVIYNFPVAVFRSQRMKNIRFKLFRPKVKLLTEEEYHLQANESTKMELEKLREYCRSPDCKAWKVISKLKNPHRFAEFVEGDQWHVTNDELLEYDSGPDLPPPHMITDDEEEDEMDFQLNSP
ncbi:nuclear envelope integral membrane protein 1-like isoform X2 [Dreissena polymorpha]|uniref:nuclear envelope integral membrane protein 1-like isoform X2 n=1 Tax=Dreissena polymorpha TaxID=45954 RepID=UPI002263B93E|nr:nuclear envelope integral membrane protein 1-like isoform X2 [Dreissena polymorpha]